MLSEKSFDLEINYVLNKIKECHTLSNDKNFIQYVIELVPLNHRILTQQIECEILKVLDDNEIIKILNRRINLELRVLFYLKIIQCFFRLKTDHFFA